MDSAKVILPPCLMPQLSSAQNVKDVVIESVSQSTASNACPWGKVSRVEAVSFNDVMSEQLAVVLQEEEERVTTPESFTDTPFDTSVDPDTTDDFLLAQMLQLEFDKEHDGILKHEEKKYNGASKVSVSFDKYCRLPHPSFSDDDDDEEIDYNLEQQAKNHWQKFEEAEKTLSTVGKSGVSKQGNTTTTKHDITMCGRRNACKMMEFPPDTKTGDSFDMELSNTVYNKLRQYSIVENRRRNKVHDKTEKATAEKTLDPKSRLILYKLVNGGVFEEIHGCISSGKESGVYHATACQTESPSSPRAEYALKIYKTTLNEFQNRDEYVKGDHRFRDRFSRQNPRKVIHLWAEKEMRNLIRMKQANIPCPDVVSLKKHILVMSFIGQNMEPAPKLKEAKVPFEDLTIMYEQTVEIMKTLYNKCRLVHADLSEYNLLWHDEKVWVIDVSQAVEIYHPRALEFLLRDCTNISNFFERQGVIGVLKPKALFTEVSGYTEVPGEQFTTKQEKRSLQDELSAEIVE